MSKKTRRFSVFTRFSSIFRNRTGKSLKRFLFKYQTDETSYLCAWLHETFVPLFLPEKIVLRTKKKKTSARNSKTNTLIASLQNVK